PVCRIAIVQARWHTPYFGPEAWSHSKSMRHAVRKVLVGILILFLLPLAVHAALYAGKDRPASFRDADWSSVGMLPPADADRDARRAGARDHAAVQRGGQGLPRLSLRRANRQRHRRRSLAVGSPRDQVGLGRGHRD